MQVPPYTSAGHEMVSFGVLNEIGQLNEITSVEGKYAKKNK